MGDPSKNSVIKEEKWINHYSNFQKILLVGEGDFSFSVSLANAFGSASNMVATSLDSEDDVKQKYSKGETKLKILSEMGCTIIHGVDAHTMSYHLFLYSPFDRIVFNFPHVAPLAYREHDIIQIQVHQELVTGFLRNASDMLTSGGEVHVTHKTAHPFSKWEIETLANGVGLNLLEKDVFEIWKYPGYRNKRGIGFLSKFGTSICDYSFPLGECSTFKFVL
ncbi:hypothetical protein M5689_001753 [Euphorbia peplus]|nr:hypothetical protein M5689_001753 [Euphorbia peplus]